MHLLPKLLRSLLCLGTLLTVGFALEPQKIPVWPGGEAPNGDGSTSPATTVLTVYRPEEPNGAAMIICPGGGYAGLVTDPEGHGIAKWLAGHGIAGLVLEYRLPKGRSMVPLLDAQRAIRLARANAGAWKIDPDRLGIIGFSAGGHLAATAATKFDPGATVEEAKGDPVARFSSRPDFAIMIYPVITLSGDAAHGGSRDNLLGPNASKALLEEWSADRQVSDKTPPCFLAHAKDDTLVPIENSQLFADALKRHHVAGEFLKLDSGGHGLSGYHGPSWDAWQAGALKWLDAQGFLKAKTTAASGDHVIPASDAKVQQALSPLNWIKGQDSVSSAVCGASLRCAFPGANRVSLNVDTAQLKYSSPERYPILGWSVNGGPVQTHQLAAGESQFPLCQGVNNPIIDLYIKGMSPFEDRFHGEVPANAVSITGFTVPTQCRGVSLPPAAPLWLTIGDSILSGDAAAFALKQGRPADDLWAASDDARASYGYLLAQHYGWQESRLAFGGYAWTGGLGGNPQLAELVDHISSGTPRLPAGQEKFSPAPKVVLINLGENGAPPAEPVMAALTKLRQRCGAETQILVMVPASGRARNEVTTAVDAYIKEGKDERTHVIDVGQISFDTADGQHPTTAGHRKIYEAALPLCDKWLK